MSDKKVYIYTLVDPRNNEVFYVGFTENLKRRYNQHINVYGKKREKNPHKNNIINKILVSGLKPEMKIIDECNYVFNKENNKYEHELLEIFYIKKYKDQGVNLTNLTNGGDGGCRNSSKKRVFQYSETGEYLKEFTSITEVADFYDTNIPAISRVIDQKRRNSYKNMYFFFSKEKANSFKFKETRKSNIPIVQYSLNGEFIREFKSQEEASKIIDIPQPNINKCLNKKRKQAGNFYWYYKNEIPENIEKYEHEEKYYIRAICKYTINNVYLGEYLSIAEAERINNLSCGLISNCLRSRAKTAGGYIWKYKDDVNNNIKN